MIAVALGLLGLVIMIASGVAASSTGGDHLTFLGVGVQTTTAQVFMTGAIFGWVFVIALWLLRVGMQRSGERCAQLAARRSRRASEWLGFGEAEQDDGWGGWDDWGGAKRRAGSNERGARFRAVAAGDFDSARLRGEVRGHKLSEGPGDRGGAWGWQPDGIRFRTTAPIDAGGGQPGGTIGRAGAARDGRGAPGRADGGADQAHRAGAGAADQPGSVGGGHAVGPVAGRLPGIGVDGGAQGGQVGGGSGAVAGEDRGAEGEGGSGESRQ